MARAERSTSSEVRQYTRGTMESQSGKMCEKVGRISHGFLASGLKRAFYSGPIAARKSVMERGKFRIARGGKMRSRGKTHFSRSLISVFRDRKFPFPRRPLGFAVWVESRISTGEKYPRNFTIKATCKDTFYSKGSKQ